MKFTVTSWFKNIVIQILGRFIEVLFRVILFFLPLGLYLLVIQARAKASKISNLSVYTTDNSSWQHVFPGFILVAIDPDLFKKQSLEVKRKFQNWVLSNKYILEFLFMATIVLIMIIQGVK